MILFVHLAQLLVGDVGINLSCGNRSVSKHALNAANVSAVLQQISGEAVAERVWADFFHDSTKQSILLNYSLDRSCC